MAEIEVILYRNGLKYRLRKTSFLQDLSVIIKRNLDFMMNCAKWTICSFFMPTAGLPVSSFMFYPFCKGNYAVFLA